MNQYDVNNIGMLMVKDTFVAFWSVIKALPWWCWVVVAILILITIFNNLMSQERSRVGKRYDNQIELFIDNLFYYLFQRGKVIKSGISEIDKMSGKDFEFYLKYLFERLGYKATHVGTSYADHRGDFGGDVIIEKDGLRTAVQAKCYGGLVGIDAVREVMGAMKYYQCPKAIVVTNSNFTNEAKTQAQASEVELWDRNKLVEVIASSKQ